jgi:hypothetical protein
MMYITLQHNTLEPSDEEGVVVGLFIHIFSSADPVSSIGRRMLMSFPPYK